MAKAVQLDSKNWRCKAYYQDETGKTRSKSFTAATKKEAEFLAAQYLIDFKIKQKPENKTVGQLIDRYIDIRAAILSPATIKSYTSVRNFAFTSIADVKIGFLTNDMVQKTINEWAKEHKPKSVKNAYTLLAAALKGKANFEFSINLPQKQKEDMPIPSTEQIDIIYKETEGTSLYLPILFAAQLGLRRSEIGALTWEDIDIKNKTVRINKAKVKDVNNMWVIKGTKTYNSARTLELTDDIIAALPQQDKPLVFISPDRMSLNFEKLMKKLNMNQFSFHSLRHYNASIMLQLGIPDKYAMERMGHSSNNMLKKVYQHTFKDEHKAAAEKLAAATKRKEVIAE